MVYYKLQLCHAKFEGRPEFDLSAVARDLFQVACATASKPRTPPRSMAERADASQCRCVPWLAKPHRCMVLRSVTYNASRPRWRSTRACSACGSSRLCTWTGTQRRSALSSAPTCAFRIWLALAVQMFAILGGRLRRPRELLPNYLEVVLRLKVHPHLAAGPKVMPKLEGHFGAHGAPRPAL
jgi:hypothetical protein